MKNMKTKWFESKKKVFKQEQEEAAASSTISKPKWYLYKHMCT